MDDDTHEILRQAIAADNKAKRDHEHWEFERDRQQRIIRKDFSGSDLLTSEIMDEPPVRVSSAPAQMDAESSAGWNKWFSQMLRVYLKPISEGFGEALSRRDATLRQAMGQAIGQERARQRDWTHKQTMITALTTSKRQAEIAVTELIDRIAALEQRVEALETENENGGSGYQG